MHDEQAISAEFRALAAEADDEYRDFARAPGAASGQDGDSILARSCVYGYLYERHFLESAEMLLNELRWLSQTDRPRPPRHAVSGTRFRRARDAILTELIARFAPGRRPEPTLVTRVPLPGRANRS